MNYLRIKHGDYKTLKKRPAAKRAFCRQNWAIKPSCLTRRQAYAPLATRGATQARSYCSLDFHSRASFCASAICVGVILAARDAGRSNKVLVEKRPSRWWFFNKVKRLWLAALKRRSQTARLSWERFIQFVAGFFPTIRTIHLLPCHRFDARTRGRSPVRQQRTPGSVRVAPCKRVEVCRLR